MNRPPTYPAARPTGYLRRTLRIARLSIHVMDGMLRAALIYPRRDPVRQRQMVQRWSKRLLDILEIELNLPHVLAADGAAFIAANHVSWLDVFVINSVCPARFVAKAEVRDWPLLGWLCARVDTVFIQRGSKRDAWRTTQTIADLLAAGHNVAVFPEGTPTDGTTLYPFHASLLEPAAKHGHHLHAVGLRFLAEDGSLCLEVAYDGERSFIDSLRGILRQRRLRAELLLAEVIVTEGQGRREIASRAYRAIAATLGVEPAER